MGIVKRKLICMYLGVLELAGASSVLAADQVTPQPYPWQWWPETHWPSFGWIFPLVCIVMMVAMLLFMSRRGGIGCTWRGRPAAKSALGILNERYARGEIDKQEYEEKKAAIASSGYLLAYLRDGLHRYKMVGEFGKFAVESALGAGPDRGRERSDPAPEVLVEEALAQTGR